MTEPSDKLEEQLRTLAPAPLSPELEARIRRQHAAAPLTRFFLKRGRMGVLDVAALIAIACLSISIFISWKPAKVAPPAKLEIVDDGKTPPPTPLSDADKTMLAELAEKLRSEDFDEREQATARLLKLEDRFLPALRELSQKADPDQRARLLTIVNGIEATALWKQLEQVAPGTDVFATDVPTEREDAVFKWARRTHSQVAIPILVGLCARLDASPRLWSCWDALNFWSAERPLMARTSASAWAGADNGTVYTQLRDRERETWNATPLPLIFSDEARKKCESARSPEQNISADRRTILANQTAAAGVGFCISSENIRILTPAEGAAHWAEWWKTAQSTPKWQLQSAPIEQRATYWLTSLESHDAAEQIVARRALVDAFDNPAVQDALKERAAQATRGGRRAREILELTTLRGLGKIVYAHESDTIKSNLWIMNPDGSGQEPLKIDGYEQTQWRMEDYVAGQFLFLRWDDHSYYWWKPGMAAPQMIAKKDAYNQQFRPGTHQVLYSQPSASGDGSGAVAVYDLDTHQHLALPVELSKRVTYPMLSPDGRWVLYSTPVENSENNGKRSQACDVWVYDFQSNSVKSLLKSKPHASLSYVSLRWSADSTWVSAEGFDYEEGKAKSGVLWMANVESGIVHDIKPDTYFACQDLLWASAGSTAYVYLIKRDEKANDHKDLFAWTPEHGLKPVALPEGIEQKYYGNIMHLRSDGRLQLNAGTKWLIDPTGKRAPEKDAADEPIAPQPLVNGWSIQTTHAVPGLVDDQIVLTSPTGALLPITYTAGDCRGPCFVPGPWPEVKR